MVKHGDSRFFGVEEFIQFAAVFFSKGKFTMFLRIRKNRTILDRRNKVFISPRVQGEFIGASRHDERYLIIIFRRKGIFFQYDAIIVEMREGIHADGGTTEGSSNAVGWQIL